MPEVIFRPGDRILHVLYGWEGVCSYSGSEFVYGTYSKAPNNSLLATGSLFMWRKGSTILVRKAVKRWL